MLRNSSSVLNRVGSYFGVEGKEEDAESSLDMWKERIERAAKVLLLLLLLLLLFVCFDLFFVCLFLKSFFFSCCSWYVFHFVLFLFLFVCLFVCLFCFFCS